MSNLNRSIILGCVGIWISVAASTACSAGFQEGMYSADLTHWFCRGEDYLLTAAHRSPVYWLLSPMSWLWLLLIWSVLSYRRLHNDWQVSAFSRLGLLSLILTLPIGWLFYWTPVAALVGLAIGVTVLLSVPSTISSFRKFKVSYKVGFKMEFDSSKNLPYLTPTPNWCSRDESRKVTWALFNGFATSIIGAGVTAGILSSASLGDGDYLVWPKIILIIYGLAFSFFGCLFLIAWLSESEFLSNRWGVILILTAGISGAVLIGAALILPLWAILKGGGIPAILVAAILHGAIIGTIAGTVVFFFSRPNLPDGFSIDSGRLRAGNGTNEYERGSCGSDFIFQAVIGRAPRYDNLFNVFGVFAVITAASSAVIVILHDHWYCIQGYNPTTDVDSVLLVGAVLSLWLILDAVAVLLSGRFLPWLRARRKAREWLCNEGYHRACLGPGLPWLVRWSGRLLAVEEPILHEDFPGYFVCSCCGNRDFMTAHLLLGVIGAMPPEEASDALSLSLFDPATRQARTADIDRLDIYPPPPGETLDYDYAVNAVLNALSEDHDRTRRLKKIPVRIHGQLVLPENTRRMLADRFGPVKEVA